MLRLEKSGGRWLVLDEGNAIVGRFADSEEGRKTAKALVKRRNAAEERKRR